MRPWTWKMVGIGGSVLGWGRAVSEGAPGVNGARAADGLEGGPGACVDTWCNPFDEQLAREGPPAVFLLDREGMLRFDETWTRDAWGRSAGPHPRGAAWVLLRDHATGYVMLALATSPTLLASHPRAEVRSYGTRAEAESARAAFGQPPLARAPWGDAC